jgi:hypothetical protein
MCSITSASFFSLCKHPLKQVQVKVETPNLDQDEEEQIHRGADRWDAARA